MPSADTFSVPPIGDFVARWIEGAAVIVDPFARNCMIGTIRNDMDPATSAQHHLPADDFCEMLVRDGVRADAVIFDPPYSPRQISECYQVAGKECGMKDTQSAVLYQRVRQSLSHILKPGGIALSFGWNTVGFGKWYDTEEIMLCCHGGAHNDTICMAQRRQYSLFEATTPGVRGDNTNTH